MPPPHILVLRLSSLGDVVLTGAVYRNLKAHWPQARITVLTKPAFAPVLAGHPAVDQVLSFQGVLAAIRDARRLGVTHVLDLHANLRSLLIAAFCGAAFKARYKKDALARRLFVWSGRRSPRLERHTLDRYLDALQAWGVPATHRTPQSADFRPSPPSQGRGSGQAGGEGPSGYKKILLLQTAFLGDAVLTEPLLRALRRAYPSSRITAVCRPGVGDVFRGAGADEVVEDAHRGAFALRALMRLGERLKGHDLAVVPHRSFRSALLAWLSGAPRRVGFSSSAGRFLLTDRVPFSWLLHDLERNLALLGPLGVAEAGAAGSARRPPAHERLAGLQRPVVAFHPGATWETKRWLSERYARLAVELMRDPGATVVLLGGPGDKAVGEAIRGQAPGVVDWIGRTDLQDLLALMPGMDLLVTNDSGPMHVAASYGVPVVAIFGPTTRELGFFPYGEGHQVLEVPGLGCRPCGLHGGRTCPEGHFLCMRMITVDQAAAAARRALAREKAAA